MEGALFMVPLKGFEPPTCRLRSGCSTPELQRHIKTIANHIKNTKAIGVRPRLRFAGSPAEACVAFERPA